MTQERDTGGHSTANHRTHGTDGDGDGGRTGASECERVLEVEWLRGLEIIWVCGCLFWCVAGTHQCTGTGGCSFSGWLGTPVPGTQCGLTTGSGERGVTVGGEEV
jgi:hypothetical protein